MADGSHMLEASLRSGLEHEAATSSGVAGRERHLQSWGFRTLAELESDDRSQTLDALDPAKQSRWRRQVVHLLNKAGSTLKVPPWGLATAALLCHRFYSRKSMKRNDRFEIATACLHLAAKVQEAPKPIREVALQCQKVLRQREPEMMELLNCGAECKETLARRNALLDQLKDEILMAERAVLFTLGFDLNIQHPHFTVLRLLADLDLFAAGGGAGAGGVGGSMGDYRDLVQAAWNLINDSYRTTLCLQYPAEKIALAAIWVCNELNKGQFGTGLENVIRAKTGDATQDFFSFFDQITPEETMSISRQMLDMYKDAGPPVAAASVGLALPGGQQLGGGSAAGLPPSPAATGDPAVLEEGGGGRGPPDGPSNRHPGVLKRRAEDGADAECGGEAKAARLGTPQMETPRMETPAGVHGGMAIQGR